MDHPTPGWQLYDPYKEMQRLVCVVVAAGVQTQVEEAILFLKKAEINVFSGVICNATWHIIGLVKKR